jgi:hypothetical protein
MLYLENLLYHFCHEYAMRMSMYNIEVLENCIQDMEWNFPRKLTTKMITLYWFIKYKPQPSFGITY